MKPHKEIELIELLLKEQRPKFRTAGEMLAWERGYLTGILASLAHNDSAIKGQLIRNLHRKRGATGKS